MDLLELQTRVPRIPHPGEVCLMGLFPDLRRSAAPSFRNRLVVREVTIEIKRQGQAGLELVQCLVGQTGELILRGSECL